MTSLLTRYETEDPVAVWRSVHVIGSLRSEDEVMALARATMKRVRQNAEIVAERLEDLGWKPLSGEMLHAPQTSPFPGEEHFEELDAAAIPPALQAFWEVVGGIDFVWDYNQPEDRPDLFAGLSIFDLDPLYVEGPHGLSYLTEEWREQVASGDSQTGDQFLIELAPDNYHKDNVSGGTPYGITLSKDIDPLFCGDNFAMRFTTYLRQAFRFGGFPGLISFDLSDDIRARVADLTDGLIAF